MKQILSIAFALVTVSLFGQLKSPEQFLPTDYGVQFTPHHEVVDYIQYVADNSDRVRLMEYGRTNEDRPLLLAYISSAENLINIEDIRNNHLASIGAKEGATGNDKAIVWLSFGVHGNEAGATESSMNTIFQLGDSSNEKTGKWLENTVIIFDPSLNPDGYSRYTHWLRGISGKNAHPGLNDREHMEPWPSGRVNHYMFDLNRDWAWQTQVESRQRIAMYNKWLPMIHVDFHEMGYNNHYYFAPAAKPYHKFISDWQRDFQVDIGRNHAKYFDSEGWLYFSREVYDLFYPSYGDTYPTFHGAIGMTYEQAGHGKSGRAIAMNNGDTLKLQDRIDHHTTTALSTVEAASNHSTELVSEIISYYKKSISNPAGKYRSYVFKNSAKLASLQTLLDRNGIKYGFASEKGSGQGYHYQSGKDQSFEIEKGDLILNAKQVKSTLIQVLMQPDPMLEDSLTYDITAWALPYAYGVEAFAMTKTIKVKTSDRQMKMSKAMDCDKAYAYVFHWDNIDAARELAQIQNKGYRTRLSSKDTQFDNLLIKKGDIIITRGDNKSMPNFDNDIQSMLSNFDCLKTGFSSKGGDLGGSRFSLMETPKALVLSGEGTGANAVGQVWYYFDEIIDYPLSIVDVNKFGRVSLEAYNTLILPDGYYNLSDDEKAKISMWVSKGGKLIAISGALSNFNDLEGYALTKYATEEEKTAAEKNAKEQQLKDRYENYEGEERRSIVNAIPGAIIKNKLDTSHPLSYGLGDYYYSLKTNRSKYKLLKDAWNVAYIPKTLESHGFIGSKLQKELPETVSFAVENKGSGHVIYMVDNPLFRGFWVNGLHLFSNAVFLVDRVTNNGI